jgi:cell volume regulation protein A
MILAAAVLLTLILFASVFHKVNVPVIILSLFIGIIFGSDVTGLIDLNNAQLVKEIANGALMFILFIGGFSTKKQHFRQVFKPVVLMSTVGVVLTALVTGTLFHLITGWPFLRALLVGSIISSTDAAAVYAIFKGHSVDNKVRTLTELESVSNDPMAVVLTTFMVGLVEGGEVSTLKAVASFVWLLVGGAGIGVLVGFLAVYVFKKIRHIEAEYFYIYLLAIVLLSYSLAELAGGSGMLSAFFAGFVMGNKQIPYKKGLLAFNNILSFITNVGLFIMLGLLAFPSSFKDIWQSGVIVFLVLTFVSRPLMVWLLTLFTDLKPKEKLFVSAVGLRGAVPIVLATYPAAVGLDSGHVIFNIVFFNVALSMLLQGTTLVPLARKLGLTTKDRNKVPKMLELVTVQDTNYEIIDIYIDDEIYEGSCLVKDLNLPPGTLITFINREGKVIAPSGAVEIKPNDTLTVLVEKRNIDMIPLEIKRGFMHKGKGRQEADAEQAEPDAVVATAGDGDGLQGGPEVSS